MNHLFAAHQLIAIVFLGSGVLATAVAIQAMKVRQGPVWRYFVYTMLAIAIWSFSDALFFALAASDDERWIWMTLGYSASVMSVPVIFAFALYFARLEHWLTPRAQFLLWAPFFLAMALAVTNRWHGLIWDRTLSPLQLTGAAGHGAYFYFMLPTAYGLALAAVIIFLQSFWRLHDLYRRQALVLSVAVLLPLISSMLYFTDLNPLPGVDLAPAAFAVTGILLLYGMTRLRVLDLRPIYRDAVFQHMCEGAMILDAAGRIADINPAAERFLAIRRSALGDDVQTALTHAFALTGALDLSPDAQHLVITPEQPPRYFDLRVAAVKDQPALMLIWHDVTRLRTAFATLDAAEQRLVARTEAEHALKHDLDRIANLLKTQVRNALNHLEHGRMGVTAALLVQMDTVTAEMLTRRTLAFYHSGMESNDYFGAVQQFATHFATTHGLLADIDIDAELNPDHLAPMTRLHVVCILQEALDNIRRHAQARRVAIAIAPDQGGVALTIRDDGIGFDPSTALPAAVEGGIAAMQRRTHLADGCLTVTAAPGAGVIVQALFPIVTGATRLAVLRDRQMVLLVARPLEREGLRALLLDAGIQVVAPQPETHALLESVRTRQPDLLLLDIDLPDAPIYAVIEQVRTLCSATRIVVLTDADHPGLPAVLHSGADGYLLKSLPPSHFFDALAQIVQGEYALAPQMAKQVMAEFIAQSETPSLDRSLTVRQQEIVALIAQGLTYDEIAAQLHLSQGAVRYHVGQIRRQLGLANRNALAMYARRHYPLGIH